MRPFLFATAVVLTLTQSADAAVCVNRFLARAEGPKEVVTLLTGKLTYQEAQELAKQRGAVTWVDDSGKAIATSIELRAVRPMPVGCDGKTSGVVMQASFLATRQPSKKMAVKIGTETVEFEEQATGQ